MKEYLDLLENILENGHKKEDRTGTGTISIFGPQMEFDLKNGFPLVTTKKVHLKSIIHELLWLLSGDTNIKYLNDNSVRIWNEWADDYGELGPIYGKQWRSWGSKKIIVPNGDNSYEYKLDELGIDQINNVINLLKTNPDSRRILVSAWNVKDLPDEGISPQENVAIGKSALPPCHLLFQFYTRIATLNERVHYASSVINKNIRSNGGKRTIELLNLLNVPTRMISLKMYQRSADVFLGVPFNIASYSLLLMMIGQVVNMIPDRYIHTIGDAHIYKNHIEQVGIQLNRSPHSLPGIKINSSIKKMDDFKYDDFKLCNYEFHPSIKGEISI